MAGSSGLASTLKIGATPVAVAEIKSISGPNVTVDTLDTSTFDSTNGYREFTTGLLDGGSVSFTGNCTSANHTALRAVLGVEDTNTVITFPTDTTITATFSAMLTSLTVDSTHDGIVEISGEFKIDGEIVWS